MTTIGSYEAKTHLSQLLDRVAKGERILITRHGIPVAALIPPEPRFTADIGESIARLRKFGKGRALKGLTIRDMIEEGRR